MVDTTLAPTRLWRVALSDEHGWTYILLLDVGNRAATLVLNDILEHKTRFDDEGRFRLVPSWLREDMQLELEAQARACALAAHAGPRKTKPTSPIRAGANTIAATRKRR